ncbi:MAG: tetratricopeptide repeat protein [Balneolaceae bacterium]|nr:tetratricopeptide repeat protein [Balneolaceae bacterium]
MYRISLAILLVAFTLTAKCFGQNAEQQKVAGHTAYIEGMEAFENEEYQDAIRLLSDAYTKLPNSGGISFALADAYMQIGDLSNASYYASQAVDMEPANKWYRLTLAEIYRLRGQNDAAIKQYRSILQNRPQDVQTLRQLAQTLEQDNQLLEANDIYNKLQNGTDADISIRLKKAKNYLELEMRDSVRFELVQIQALNPSQAATLQLISSLYLELGNADKAKALLEKTLKEHTRNPQIRIRLADIYTTQKEWKKVTETLTVVISDSLVTPEEKLTVARYILSKYNAEPSNTKIIEAATELLHSFTMQEPVFAAAHSLAAKFYVQTDQSQKALEALAKTTELQPLDDEAWKQRLQLLLEQKRFQKVTEIAPEAEKNIPQDPFILYFTGSAHFELEEYNLAAEKLLSATRYPARRTFKSQIYTALGKAQAGQSNFNEAKQSLQQAIKIDSQNAEAMEHLGNIFDKLGNQDLAKEWWQKALEKDPGRSHLKQKISG